MLSHTSGLTYGGGLPGVGIQHPVDRVYQEHKIRSAGVAQSMDEFMHKLSQVPLRYQPGTAWMYSLGTDVCGALVEIISGMPFERYLQQTIFEPLGHGRHRVPGGAEAKRSRFAANYQRAPDKSTALLDDPAHERVPRTAVRSCPAAAGSPARPPTTSGSARCSAAAGGRAMPRTARPAIACSARERST